MIVYLDSSALVKLVVEETGSARVRTLVARAAIAATGQISRAEVAAALGKAIRVGLLDEAGATEALRAFRALWPDLVRLTLTEATLARAESLAWEHGLRGYDAVHLACAFHWQECIGERVTLATFDRQLADAGQRAGMLTWPRSA